MKSEDDFDDILLALYQASTDEKIQSVINKYLVPVISEAVNPNKSISDRAVQTVNEFMSTLKSKEHIAPPMRDVTILYLKAKAPLIKNLSALFLKFCLERCKQEEQVQYVKTLMVAFKTLPQTIQPLLYKSYIKLFQLIPADQYFDTLNKFLLLTKAVLKTEHEQLSGLSDYTKSNIHHLKGKESLLVALLISFDIQVEIPNDFNIEKIVTDLTLLFNENKKESKEIALAHLAKLDHKLPLEFVFNSLQYSNGYRLLDKQVILYEDVEPYTKKIALTLINNINSEGVIEILRNMIKKYHTIFQDDDELFRKIFKSKHSGESYTALLVLYASLISPTNALMRFLENELWNGNQGRALPLFRFIFPFSDPRPRIFACVLIGDTSLMDECRLLLHPYKHIVNDSIRTCIYDDHVERPSTDSLFNNIIGNQPLVQYFKRPSSTRSIQQLFSFAIDCIPSLPLPFSFIIGEFSVCPSAASEISKFLVFICSKLEMNGKLSPADTESCLQVMKSESDPDIIESISRFLRWSKAEIDISKVSDSLKHTKKTAFLAHFGCPFDECYDMLNTQTDVSLAKRCLMALAQRNLLDETHFEKLFPKLSSDSYGIEVLSEIASGKENLYQKIVQCLFEPPLITTDRVEVVVAGAAKMSSVVDQDFIMKLIDSSLRKERSMRNASIFLLYMVSKYVPKDLWYVVRSLMYCSAQENGVVRNAGMIGLPNLLKLCNEEQKKVFGDAIHGRNKPEMPFDALIASGQPRGQVVTKLLKLAGTTEIFVQLLVALIEPEFLIFTGVNIPKPTLDIETMKQFSVTFYYESFTPTESTAIAFRRLYKWTTDGGKRLMIADVINAINPDVSGWDAQQTALNCLHDVVHRMTAEQIAEHFDQLTKVCLRIVFSPVKELKAAASEVLDKIVTKCGSNPPAETRKAIFNLCETAFNSHTDVLVLMATKWCSELVDSLKSPDDALFIFDSLFQSIASSSQSPMVTMMLAGNSWSVYGKAVFKCTEICLKPFFEHAVRISTQSYVLESSRYAALFALDAAIRAPGRMEIGYRIEEEIPRLFRSASTESSSNVTPMVVSCLQHAITAVCQYNDDSYDYDKFILDMYFENEKHTEVASLLKGICNSTPQYFRKSLGPLTLYASCCEGKSEKEYSIILRDEVDLASEVNKSPQMYIDFMFEHGVINGSLATKPPACRALYKAVKAMKQETKSHLSEFVDTLAANLDGRLYPSKENLIDCITSIVPYLQPKQELVALMFKQANRAKSTFRSAAAYCLMALSTTGVEVDEKQLTDVLIDMVKKGTGVAIKAAADVCEMLPPESIQAIASAIYERKKTAETEILPDIDAAIASLPEHHL